MPFRIVSELSTVIVSTWTVVWIYCWIRSLWTILEANNRSCRIGKFDRRIREIICWTGSCRDWYFTTYTNSMPFRIVSELSTVIVSTRTVVWIYFWIRSFWAVFKIDNRSSWIRKFDRRIREIICWSGSYWDWNITSHTNSVPLCIISKGSTIIVRPWPIVRI